MRFLHLVLFSSGHAYEQMRALSRAFYRTQPMVRTIYYCFSSDLDDDLALRDDVLTFRGDESFVPGILDKTVRAFQYFEPELGQYDYVVRSNVSTIVHFERLAAHLAAQPFDYGAGAVLRLGWLDVPAGITDGRYMGTVFGSGTSIVVSTTLLARMLQCTHHVPREIIDDVAIGVWVQRTDPTVVPRCLSAYFRPLQLHEPIDALDVAEIVFYRHRCSDDRQEDVHNMQRLLDRICARVEHAP